MVTTVWTRRWASRMRCREQNGLPAVTAAVISSSRAGPVVGVLVGRHQRGGGDDLAGGEPVDRCTGWWTTTRCRWARRS